MLANLTGPVRNTNVFHFSCDIQNTAHFKGKDARLNASTLFIGRVLYFPFPLSLLHAFGSVVDSCTTVRACALMYQ